MVHVALYYGLSNKLIKRDRDIYTNIINYFFFTFVGHLNKLNLKLFEKEL